MKTEVSTLDRLKYILENFVESEDGKFCFPDGDVWDCKKSLNNENAEYDEYCEHGDHYDYCPVCRH